jgi:hypothetical protein
MNTLHPNETAQIIQFSAVSKRRPTSEKPVRPMLEHVTDTFPYKRGAMPPANSPRNEENISVTLRNSRLRDQRYKVWRAAEARQDYWHKRLKFESAIGGAQRHDLPEGDLHPPHDHHKDYMPAVEKWRAALVAMLLTPAPTVAAVTWKKAALKAGQHKHTTTKTERIEQAITADIEWLNAHPTRTKLLKPGAEA